MVVTQSKPKRSARPYLARFDKLIFKPSMLEEELGIVRLHSSHIERIFEASSLVVRSDGQVRIIVSERRSTPMGVEIKLSLSSTHGRARDLNVDTMRFFLSHGQTYTYTLQLLRGGEFVIQDREIPSDGLELALQQHGIYDLRLAHIS